MQLIIIGSGTGIPLADRCSPCLLLLAQGGYNLFDLGPGSLRQLVRTGISHERISRIFLTHFHPDHTADLVHFFFATRNPDILKRRGPFVVVGARGMSSFLQQLQDPYGKWLRIPPPVMAVDELDNQAPDTRQYDEFTLLSQPLEHTPHSVAYRVQDRRGKSFVYSGDTGYSPQLIRFARESDLLILECSFPEGREVDGHLTPAQAGRIAHLSGSKKLLLLHFFPEVLATDISGECRKTYSGELLLGRDLMHVVI